MAFGLCFYLVILKLLGHGGATSKDFGHVTTYKATTLPTCDLCYKSKVWYCQSGQTLHQCNNCTGWDIYDHPKASMYCELLHGYPTTQMSDIEPSTHLTINEQHLVPYQSSFEWLSCGVKLAEMEVQLGNWSKGQCNVYLHSNGLNNAISETVYDATKQNTVCADEDIKCPIPQ